MNSLAKTTDNIQAQLSLSAGGRVLVVENDKGNAFVISTILDLLDYEYDLVESGEKALEAIRHNAYIVMVMDIVLDGMSGIQTTECIRAYERGHGLTPVYIIATSIQFCSELKDACLKAGINDFLCKPYHLKAISDHLENHQAFVR